MNYIVSTTGNNANAGTVSAPWRTLNYAATRLVAGDTLQVRGGTYNESLLNVVPSGSSWSNKVRIANYPGETVWMKPLSGAYVVYFNGSPCYIEFDGINLDGRGGISDASVFFDDRTFGDPHHIRFQSLEIAHRNDLSGGNTNAAVLMGGHHNEFLRLNVHGIGGPYGFYVHGHDQLIDGCWIHDTATAFVQIYHNAGSDGFVDYPRNNTVRNCLMQNISTSNQWGVADGRQWGVIIYAAFNNRVYNNVITGLRIAYAGGNAAIAVSADGNQIWHNTISDCFTEGITLGAGVGTEVRNNIVWQVTGAPYTNGGTGTIQSNNLFGVNPQFVNAGAGNYQVLATSPARNAGVTIAAITSDIAGTLRPQEGIPDIGAYEFGGGAPPAAPTGLRITP